MYQEEISFQSIADNKDILISYSDEDVIIIDSIQKLAEVTSAHVSLNVIAICNNGKIQARMGDKVIELHKNQVAIMPPNMTFTDLMFSPDLDLKAMCFTSNLLQSFLREKMNVWNEVMYIHHNHIFGMLEEDMPFYTHFYEMFRFIIEQNTNNPYRNEIIQSLLRCAILELCGAFKQMLSVGIPLQGGKSADNHFQRFLELLNSTKTKHRTVESYANDLCLSPKYLSTICKKMSGKTANEWITEHVLEDIRYYLKHTDYSIKQISQQMGFPNSSFFGKYVKEHFHQTPLQIRMGAK